MVIGFLTPEYITEDYYSGGLANYLHRTAKLLSGMGHDIHIFTLSKKNEKSFPHDGVTVHRVKTHRICNIINRHSFLMFKETLFWLSFSFRLQNRVKKIHEKKQFDLIQIANSRGCGIFTILRLKIPCTIRISGYRPLWNKKAGVKRNPDKRIVEWMESFQNSMCNFIYTPSTKLKHILEKQEKKTSIRAIPPPFYLETLKWDWGLYNNTLKDKEYILFIGRMQLHKGFHILARALPRILKENKNIDVVVAGLDSSTYLAPSMKAYAINLCGSYSDRLTFLGQVHHESMYPIIKKAKIVILPSLIDNMPNTCLESMALGRPVIGTYGTSFDEIITDNINGFLTPPGDARALSKRVIEEWNNPVLEKIGMNAKKKMLDFSPDNVISELERFYRQVIKGPVQHHNV